MSEIWTPVDYSSIQVDESYRHAKEFYGEFVNDERIPMWYKAYNPLRGGCESAPEQILDTIINTRAPHI